MKTPTTTGILLQIIPAWPARPADERSPSFGHWALYANADRSSYQRPIVSWGIVEQPMDKHSGQVTRAVLGLVCTLDGELVPASSFHNFIGILEPGDVADDLMDELIAWWDSNADEPESDTKN